MAARRALTTGIGCSEWKASSALSSGLERGVETKSGGLRPLLSVLMWGRLFSPPCLPLASDLDGRLFCATHLLYASQLHARPLIILTGPPTTTSSLSTDPNSLNSQLHASPWPITSTRIQHTARKGPAMPAVPSPTAAFDEIASSLLTFYLNGTRVQLDASTVDPEASLLSFIRSQPGLTGTKLGCGEGGCGACTVVIQSVHPRTGEMQHLAINACLAPLLSVEGKHVSRGLLSPAPSSGRQTDKGTTPPRRSSPSKGSARLITLTRSRNACGS